MAAIKGLTVFEECLFKRGVYLPFKLLNRGV